MIMGLAGYIETIANERLDKALAQGSIDLFQAEDEDDQFTLFVSLLNGKIAHKHGKLLP